MLHWRLAALIGGGLAVLAVRSAPAQDGAGPAPPAGTGKPAVHLPKGTRVLYRYREVVDMEAEIRPGDDFKQKNRADTTWDVEIEGLDPRPDGDVDVAVKWTRIAGKTRFLFGENVIDTAAEKPVKGDAPQPSNTRESRLVRLTNQASVVTLSPLGSVRAVQGPVRVLLEFYEGPKAQTQKGPLAEADLAATYERWFPSLPEQKVRTGTSWNADRTLAPDVFTVIDLQTYGRVPEKYTVKSVKGDVLTATFESRKRAGKKRPDEERKDPPTKGPDDVRPHSLGVGEPWTWDLSGEVEIDLASGLYLSRRSKLQFTAGEWKSGTAYAARGSVEVTLERRKLEAPAVK